MKKIVIIGGGVSGITCAIKAKNENNEVIVLEKNQECLKKLLVTGNGRCNFYNDDQDLSHYYSDNRDLLSKIFTERNTKKVLKFIEDLGIVPRIKNGYYYPYSNQASSIKTSLLLEAKKKGIIIINNFTVSDVTKVNDKFKISGMIETIYSDVLVLATGSNAFSISGSTKDGYKFINEFDHTINPVLPALVQLRSNESYFKIWSGVRSDVKITLYENEEVKKEEFGEIQLTNYGISGICVFNLSLIVSKGLYENKKEYVKINFVPFLDLNSSYDFYKWTESRMKKLGNRRLIEVYDGVLNYKLIEAILKKINLNPHVYYNSLSEDEKRLLCENIYSLRVDIYETNSYEKAQVCLGGLSINEVKTSSFESKKVENLFVIGELLDITGECGGYNLTNAFLTGILSGEGIKKLDKNKTN